MFYFFVWKHMPMKPNRQFPVTRSNQCILYVDGCQFCSTVQNLVVNYHLVVSYPQQCHIEINLNH